jgi:replicative DNA helicase
MKANHPDYRFLLIEETFESLVDEVRKSRKLAIMQETLARAVDAYDAEDPELAASIMSKGLQQTASELPNSLDTDLSKTGLERLERYRKLAEQPEGLKGLPTGISVIDKATGGGLQPKQLVIIAGPPKAGKSTLLLLIAMCCHAFGVKPLFIGFEMTNEEQESRHDAIGSKVSHTKLQQGRLPDKDWDRLDKFVRTTNNMHSFIMSSDTNSVTTLSGVAAKIDEYRPDVVLIDGVYLMDDENGEAKGSPQALTNLTRGLKRLGQNSDLCIVGTTQVLASKMSPTKGIILTSVGYSSSFGQDADALIGVASDENTGPNVNRINVVASRHCAPCDTLVEWDWDTPMFYEYEGAPTDEDDSPSHRI